MELAGKLTVPHGRHIIGVLIRHQCFGCHSICTASRFFPTGVRLRVSNSLGGDTAWTANKLTKIIFHAIWCHLYQWKLEEEEAVDACDYDTGLTKQLLCMLETWSPGKWLHIHLSVESVLVLQASFDFLIMLFLFLFEVFLLSFYFCLVWREKSVSKRLGRSLAAGKSQPTTPNFKFIVTELFVHFV